MKSLVVALAFASAIASCASPAYAQGDTCVTEAQVAEVMAPQGYVLYRRIGDVQDPSGRYETFLVYLNSDDKGFGVWFNSGCVVDAQPGTKAIADRYIAAALPPI